ncbi:hypothetical protein [Labrenzia sp. R5_0]|uniref:hypothetical protein n=1 Tax=Labrenzia sp. R5_0 TaxID=2821108 RepID=UPI00336BE033
MDTAEGSNQSSGYSAGVSVGIGLGANGAGPTFGASASVNGAKGSNSSAWVNAPSGIVTDNALNADVGETTSITGGVIASRSGDLTLETERLETADIDLHRKGRQVSGSVGVSIGSNPEGKSKPGITVEGAYSNSETEGVARATIGEGEITVRDGDGDGIKAADLEAEADAAEAEGDTARAEALRAEAELEAAEDKTTTETQLANINRDPDAVVVVTSRKEEGFELYLSDTSLEKAVEGIEVTGKALGEAFRALGEELAASGALTPSELDTAKTVAKAIDEGDLDLRALVTCSGRRGFNLWELVVSSAHAATGCVLFDENGREIAELTPREREACVQMLSRLLEEYARDYLVGERGDTELPASITKTAESLREMASDEVLVAGAQSLGMSVSLIRDVTMRLALGEEKYAEYKKALKPLADAGELSSEAVARTVERLATEQGLSNQEVKDLKLVATVTTAAIVTALGTRVTRRAVSIDDIPGIGPTPGKGGFSEWFNNLNTDDFVAYWSNPATRSKIQRMLREPGGFHEWAMVSRADKFHSWGFTAQDIWSFRTSTKKLNWINPQTGLPGKHGGHGSGAFHNELGQLIDNSGNVGELQSGLVSLGHRWAIPNLPTLIRR